ncbi:CapA family protein [Neobacillus muris]|uniref:CapA family protein n=1 Tax=Neobacillus muris TaxID=2941334 RepID=UPI00203A6689|nr:CapA family protein [Neobacillus muris]
MKKSLMTSISIVLGCSILAYALLTQPSNKTKPVPKVYSEEVNPQRPAQTINRVITEKITVGAIGDILIHSPVYQDAFNGSQYEFDQMFSNVKSLLEKPDLLTANLESTLGGIELGLSGYPTFNSPHEVADALVHSGVDIVSTANNHTLDKGEKGILSEIAYLESIGLPHVGSFQNEQDRHKLRVIEKNGIKLAFLSYTYGTNGIPVPKGKDYLVNLIDRKKMKEEIHRAKEASDAVVMSIHWGNEYQRFPNQEQKDLARFLANEGVDILFGSHPHVLQPMQWIERADGRKTFVIYSLGNFISAQYGDYKDIGGLATVEITKRVSEQGKTVELSSPAFYPTYVTSQTYNHFRVVPLEQAGSAGLKNADAKYDEIQQHMNQWLK